MGCTSSKKAATVVPDPVEPAHPQPCTAAPLLSKLRAISSSTPLSTPRVEGGQAVGDLEFLALRSPSVKIEVQPRVEQVRTKSSAGHTHVPEVVSATVTYVTSIRDECCTVEAENRAVGFSSCAESSDVEAAAHSIATTSLASDAPLTSNGDAATSAHSEVHASSVDVGAHSEHASGRALGSQSRTRKIRDHYQIGEVLGHGGFGDVYKGTRLSDGLAVAIKSISKLKFASAEDRASMVTEVDLMHRVVGHPNVVAILDSFEDKANFWIVCELCSGGELMARVLSSALFSEQDAAWYFRQMLLGVQHCHNHLVVHRDLKPENFLLHSSDAKPIVKLTDFGLSTAISSPDAEMTDGLGSAYYIAPEIFRRKYTKAVDAWALGVILYLLLSGEVPFGHDADTETEVYHAIQTAPLRFKSVWNDITPYARELVTGLLEKDASKRYTIEQALVHPWVVRQGEGGTVLDRSIITSLTAFDQRNKLQKLVLKTVADKLKANDVQQLRESFMEIDADNTGYITVHELRAALLATGYAAGDVDAEHLLRQVDTDGDRRISWQEFLVATLERHMVRFQATAWEAFCELDVDGSGTLSVTEIRNVLKDESPEAVQRYMEEFDIDKDGVINYEEFMRMLLPKDIKYRIARIPSSA